MEKYCWSVVQFVKYGKECQFVFIKVLPQFWLLKILLMHLLRLILKAPLIH